MPVPTDPAPRRGPGRLLAAAAATSLASLAGWAGLAGAPGVAAAATPVQVAPAPCGAAAGSTACRADPTGLAVSWPAITVVGGITLSWVPTGRPAGAPSPAATSAALSVTGGRCSTSLATATTTCSWSWPGDARLPAGGQLLNGTYQVAACADDPEMAGPGPCPAPPGLAPASIGVGVAPAAPPDVVVAGTSSLTVRWARSGDPDVAGYQVARDGHTIWSCATDGAAGSTVCPAAPSVRDTPPAGHHAYVVTALAYGADPGQLLASAAPAVTGSAVAAAAPGASSPGTASPGTATSSGGTASQGTAAVTGQGGAGQASGSAAGPALGPVPYVGPAVTLPPVRPPDTPAATTAPAAATPGDSGFAATLPYGAGAPSPAVLPLAAPPPVRLAAAPAPTRSDLDRTAVFALGVLVLAVAAHLVFLRSELRRREALWRALRDAAGAGRPPPAAPGPGRRSTVLAGAGPRPPSPLEALLLWRPGGPGAARRPRRP